MHRRKFLQSSFASTAYLAISQVHAVVPKQARIGIAGLGGWGEAMLAQVCLTSGLESIGICDLSPARAIPAMQRLMTRYPQLKVSIHESVPVLLGEFRPHAMVIATPDHLRASHALLALQHGSHVFTGEAAGLSPGDLDEVSAASRRAGRLVQTSLPGRSDPVYRSAFDLLKSGLPGEILSVHLHHFSSGTPPVCKADPETCLDLWNGPVPSVPADTLLVRAGAWRRSATHSLGPLGEHGIPLLDFLCWWAGESPATIYSTGGSNARHAPGWTGSTRPANPEQQIVFFDFPRFRATWEHRHLPAPGPVDYSSGISINGARGSLQLTAAGSRAPAAWTFAKAGSCEVVLRSPAPATPAGPGPAPLHHSGSAALWEDFMHAVRTGRGAVPDLEIANRSARFVMHAMRSLATGETMRLSPDGTLETASFDFPS